MNQYSVYVHINNINGKTYVGQTNNIVRRWRNNGIEYKPCEVFYKAILKYGWDNFTHIELVSGLTKEDADKYESYYMDFFQSRITQNGYNVREAGSHGALSEQTK
jgi:group I intron endonuclease